MEPKFSSPELNAQHPPRTSESLPNAPALEQMPDSPLSGPEVQQSTTVERAGEYATQAQAAVAAQASTVSLPTPVLTADDTATSQAADDLPAAAADDDLIEKEWVDKAKQIISETHDDPAARERQVSRLQADYLKKRYGKHLGASEE